MSTMNEGTFRIGLVRCSNGPDYYCVDISDNKSGVRVAEVRLTLEQFAMAIGSQVISDAEMEFGPLEKVGLKHEHKSEAVVIEDCACDEFEAMLRFAVEPYEVDGWKASIDKRWNHHRMATGQGGQKLYSVSFHRWVQDNEVQE